SKNCSAMPGKPGKGTKRSTCGERSARSRLKGRPITVNSAAGSAARRARSAGVAQRKSPMREARTTTTRRGGSGRRASRPGAKGSSTASCSLSCERCVARDHLGEQIQRVAVDRPGGVQHRARHLGGVGAGGKDAAAAPASHEEVLHQHLLPRVIARKAPP